MKFLWISLVLLATQSSTWAFQPQRDEDGTTPFSVENFGVSVLYSSYSTVATVMTFSTAANVIKSTYVIHGVITSTAPTGATSGVSQTWVELRATNTRTGSSELLYPKIFAASTTANTFVVFKPPLLAPLGFSLRNSSSEMCSAVFFTMISSADPITQDYIIPVNDYGEKAFSHSVYGTKVASEVIAGATANTVGTEALDYIVARTLVSVSSVSAQNNLYWNGATTTVRGEKGFWYGWAAGTGSVTAFFIVRDTGTILGTPEPMMPPIFYRTLSINNAGISYNLQTSQFNWPWPVRYNNGITIERSPSTNRDEFRMFRRNRLALR